MVFKEKKKKYFIVFLAFFLFSGAIFAFSDVQSVSAAAREECGWDGLWDCMKGNAGITVGQVGNVGGDVLTAPFKALFYALFVFTGWLASAALTLFEWVIKPENISGPSGLLNQPNIYEMWKFIRDFFNLFFILVLLYIAFTVVFQIQKNFKKALLSLILAALFVNFSYPISRLLIDVTNVPMYFFANQISGIDAATGTFGQALSVSGLQNILLPGSGDSGGLGIIAMAQVDFSDYIVAIVFMFIFAITLVVLAVMFIIRLVALMILVVFSSVGFVASIIPGMKEYSDMWWKNFWKYAFFGPAAMLMLLVATRFFSAMGDKNAGVFAGLKQSAGSISADPTFIASLAMFSFPIIILWMAIGLAQTMSLAGAASVSGKGKAFAKWAGRKTYNNPVGRGLAGGAKKVGMEGKIGGLNYGKLPGGKFLTGDYWATPSKVEAGLKGGIAGGVSGGKKELAKLHQKEVNEQVKKNKENQVSRTALMGSLDPDKNDLVTRQAAALSLAENGDIRTADVLSKALEATKGKDGEYDQDLALKVVDKAKSEAIGDMKAKDYAAIAGHNSSYRRNDEGDFELDKDNNKIPEDSLATLNSKLKKEGNIKVRVDYEINQKVKTGMTDADKKTAKEGVYDDFIGKLGADDLAKQGSIHSSLEGDKDLSGYLKERADKDNKFYQEVLKKMSKKDREMWSKSGITPEGASPSDEGASPSNNSVREKMKQVKKDHGR